MLFTERPLLYVTVMMTGAAVMMLELLGSRIIEPFFGNSLYVWSSLLSVTLSALAAGYFLGGWASDNLKRFRLSYIVSLAAFSTAMIAISSNPILSMTSFLGVRAGTFFSTFLLFSIPLTFLGMVCPNAIKLSTSNAEDIGMTVGSIYALSTVGSVLGTLLLGFLLLPAFGSRSILYSISGSLFLLALLVALHERKELQVDLPPLAVLFLSVICLILVAIMSSLTTTDIEQQTFKTLYETESLYGSVRVIEEPARNVRWMFSDTAILSAVSLSSSESMLGYQAFSEVLLHLKPDAQTALLIGLGNGTIAHKFHTHGVTMDSIENNPAVVEAAQYYFNFKPSGRLLIGDARYQLQTLQKQYDFIIQNSFSNAEKSAHLLSIEALQSCKRQLTSGGILALNLVGFTDNKNRQAASTILRTLNQVFKQTHSYVSVPETDFGDVVFYASDQPIVQSSIDSRILAWLNKRKLKLSTENSTIITDDFNPLVSLQARQAETYRKNLLQRVDTQLLL